MPTLEEREETFRVFGENLAQWLALPAADKIVAIVAAINKCEADMSKVFNQLKAATKYPFGEDSDGDSNDVCIHAGRIRFKDGRLVDWQIWKTQHVVRIINWGVQTRMDA